jgi:hypothetical protein
MQPAARNPLNCPAGFLGRYRVVSGDSMFTIASFFRRPLSELIRANPHIVDPTRIFPGDVLCVPGQIPYPCSVLLQPVGQVPTGTEAVALVHISSQGTQAVTVAATLPPPGFWGNFDIYLAEVIVSQDMGGFGNQLFPTPLALPTWSVTIDLPTVVSLTPTALVRILPSNSETGISGEAILQNDLAAYLRADACDKRSVPPSHRRRRLRRRR